jgi:hypothetical protein
MSITEKLRLLREGSLLLEAPDNKYDLPKDTDNTDPAPADPKPDDATKKAEPDDAPTDDAKPSDSDNTGVDLGGGDDTGEDTTDNSTGDDSATSDDSTGDNQDNTDDYSSSDNLTQDPQPKPGELLNLDPNTRAMLEYKNFSKFRDLKTAVTRMLTELSNLQTATDEIRDIIDKTIETSSDLSEKLNDYILYKYTNNSYEINYKNYMVFIVEKNLIDQLLYTIRDKVKEIDKNK